MATYSEAKALKSQLEHRVSQLGLVLSRVPKANDRRQRRIARDAA